MDESTTREPADRTLLFGRFNVARDYHMGVFIICIIPVGTFVCLRVLAFSPVVLELYSYNTMLVLTCFIILLCVLSEWTVVSLFLCDPGFTDAAEDEGAYRCPLCRIYVKEYDHHCGILGVCIGERNMGFFLFFLTFVSFLMWLFVWFAGVSLMSWFRKAVAHRSLYEGLLLLLKEWWFSSKIKPVTFVLFILLCYGALFTTMLGVFYWCLLCWGMLSLERRRKPSLRMKSRAVFCHMWRPSLSRTALLHRNAENDV
ncbi:putative palmitoyl acyltransferase 9 [Trypanosoma cruzi]|uniref:Palmitoyltransferase n=1 Tax=Trypanosoma cruzi TaxID=5693 RepID=A0A2V2VR97_TRYCR|nr:putative palmitoyl acyltransferase 9 [Trypanosoma cruzi]PWU97952.1 putative palmitoyl acyltransferase 9 [Trypanosoma cruzi]